MYGDAYMYQAAPKIYLSNNSVGKMLKVHGRRQAFVFVRSVLLPKLLSKRLQKNESVENNG